MNNSRLLSLDVMRGITIAGMIQTCALERIHPDRHGFSFLYVYDGNLRLFLFAKI